MVQMILICVGILLLSLVTYIYFRLFAGRPGELPNPDNTQAHFVKADDGTTIHYLTMGKGTPVLLIHGFFANADLNWFKNGIAQELAKTNLVIALDNRGHGKSEKPYSKAAYGDHMWRDAILVLDHMKIEKAHIHGYSMGGSILTQILFHYPERVITATYGGAGIPELNQGLVPDIMPNKNATVAAKIDEKKARIKMKLGFAHNYISLFLIWKNAPWSGPEHKKIDLGKIEVPVLSIAGEYDFAAGRTSRMKRELKNYKEVILPGKSHLTSIVEGFMPQEYALESVNFIRSHQKQDSPPI